MRKCEVTPMPCQAHRDHFMGLNPDAVYDTRHGEECGYCQIETAVEVEPEKYLRCSKCEKGVIVNQHRHVGQEYFFDGTIESHLNGRTFVGPTYAICTQGCSVKTAEGGWADELEAKQKEAS